MAVDPKTKKVALRFGIGAAVLFAVGLALAAADDGSKPRVVVAASPTTEATTTTTAPATTTTEAPTTTTTAPPTTTTVSDEEINSRSFDILVGVKYGEDKVEAARELAVSACEALDQGATIEQLMAVVALGMKGNEEAGGYIVGAGISAFCPEYSSLVP